MILKLVPRDHVDQLPVPKRIKDYLKTPNYYSENEAIEETEESTELSDEMAAILMPKNDEEQPNNQASSQDIVAGTHLFINLKTVSNENDLFTTFSGNFFTIQMQADAVTHLKY